MLEIEDHTSADFSRRTERKYHVINYFHYEDISGDDFEQEDEEDE